MGLEGGSVGAAAPLALCLHPLCAQPVLGWAALSTCLGPRVGGLDVWPEVPVTPQLQAPAPGG